MLLLRPSTCTAQITGASRTALAVVEDIRTHRTIVDVGADDFVVQEGTEPREILSVRLADYPVVVMIDTGASEADLPLLRKAARNFIERLGSERPVAVGTYGESATLIAGFDADRIEVMEKLDALAATTSGSGSVQQAAGRAAEAIGPTGSLFSSIVMLSASHGDGEASGARDADSFDATPSVIASGAMLYVVAVRRPSPNPSQESSHADSLRTVADQTRGQFITIYTAASFDAALDQIAKRMASELMIEYLVPNQSKAADVQLGVRVPGARVRGLGVR